jgi:hypothetical protein
MRRIFVGLPRFALPETLARSMIGWVAALTLLACASQPKGTDATEQRNDAQTANVSSMPLLPVDQKLSGRDVAEAPAPKGFVLVREFVDSVKTPRGDEYQRVVFGWDYDAGVAIEKREHLDGRLISQEPQPALTMITTPEELAYAFWLAKSHPVIAPAMARADSIVSGGFSYREAKDPACFERSRCVHVIVSGGNNGEVPLAHAIIDLMTRRVVHPKFTPNMIP